MQLALLDGSVLRLDRHLIAGPSRWPWRATGRGPPRHARRHHDGIAANATSAMTTSPPTAIKLRWRICETCVKLRFLACGQRRSAQSLFRAAARIRQFAARMQALVAMASRAQARSASRRIANGGNGYRLGRRMHDRAFRRGAGAVAHGLCRRQLQHAVGAACADRRGRRPPTTSRPSATIRSRATRSPSSPAHGIGTASSPIIAGARPGLYAITLTGAERSFTYWRSDAAARQAGRRSGRIGEKP